MPSARVRYASEAAFLILVALGLALAEFDPFVIGIVMVVGLMLVVLLERASSREVARAAEAQRPPRSPSPGVEPVKHAPMPEPEREAIVSARSARAILASGLPPLPPEPGSKPQAARRRLVERAVGDGPEDE